ncbi:hypothetical protein TPENAI_61135 [Tenacibaculum litopenaei]|uniref:hypothetical protein n=1 Tax=Tenacibaculum litopenaei TaxID=396016 RepID=UPI003892FCD7
MMKTAMTAVVSLGLCLGSSQKNSYAKYAVPNGELRYKITFPLLENPVHQKLYFSNYGASQLVEMIDSAKQFKTNLILLKNDSLAHVFMNDSDFVSAENSPEFAHEKVVNSLAWAKAHDGAVITKQKDTLFQEKNCSYIEFHLQTTAMKGFVIYYRDIPLKIKYPWDTGMVEELVLTAMKITTAPPAKLVKYQKAITANQD